MKTANSKGILEITSGEARDTRDISRLDVSQQRRLSINASNRRGYAWRRRRWRRANPSKYAIEKKHIVARAQKKADLPQ